MVVGMIQSWWMVGWMPTAVALPLWAQCPPYHTTPLPFPSPPPCHLAYLAFALGPLTGALAPLAGLLQRLQVGRLLHLHPHLLDVGRRVRHLCLPCVGRPTALSNYPDRRKLSSCGRQKAPQPRLSPLLSAAPSLRQVPETTVRTATAAATAPRLEKAEEFEED